MKAGEATIRNLKDLVTEHEGRTSFVYDTSTGKPLVKASTLMGHMTTGVGRNLSTVGLRPNEIDYLLENDLRIAEDIVINALGHHSPPKDSARWAALVDMAFTLGEHKFYDFRYMLKAASEGRWTDAAEEVLDSVWARHQASERAERDAEMIRSNKWEGE